MVRTVLVVGAGLTGLTAARRLCARGVDCLLLDKGRALGGRLATRRLEHDGKTYVFDHGAQYFTARSPEFVAEVEMWVRDGIVKVWADDFASTASRQADVQKYPRYCSTQGMNGLAKHLAKDLLIQTNHQVKSVDFAPKFVQYMSASIDFDADALVLTMPVPQAIELLAACEEPAPFEVQARAGAVRYAPCLALMVLLDGPSALPAPGGMFAGPEPLSWIADNSLKGISGSTRGCLTLHAGPEFSAANYTADEAVITSQMLDAARPYLGTEVVTTSLHRWKFSLPTITDIAPFLHWKSSTGTPIYLGGDAFAGPRVEGAYRSGRAIADALLGV
ncbi:MAG: NAD(P)/FAD-dependent oxidoreductase [Fimbriiglobus sp.]